MKNILLLKGGAGAEHDVSLVSAQYIASQIDTKKFNIIDVIIEKNFKWFSSNKSCYLGENQNLIFPNSNESLKIDAAIPCIHGQPGETGEIQSYLSLKNIPFLGCQSEASVLCFNKLATKLWLESVGLKTTPFLNIHKDVESSTVAEFFDQHKSVYIKATNQGSSVGCYPCNDKKDLHKLVNKAFEFSPFVIIEKTISGRELEVAAFEHEDKLYFSKPGEIVCPDDFYSYEEKYSKNSTTQTYVEAINLQTETIKEIQRQAKIAFQSLKLRHLSRIDFFLTDENEVYINEINTFPGHTSISMFPLMLENMGISYFNFLNGHLEKLVQD